MKKYTLEDLERALAYFKKNCQGSDIIVRYDVNDRLELKSKDSLGADVTITIYGAEHQMKPDITKKDKL